MPLACYPQVNDRLSRFHYTTLVKCFRLSLTYIRKPKCLGSHIEPSICDIEQILQSIDTFFQITL